MLKAGTGLEKLLDMPIAKICLSLGRFCMEGAPDPYQTIDSMLHIPTLRPFWTTRTTEGQMPALIDHDEIAMNIKIQCRFHCDIQVFEQV